MILDATTVAKVTGISLTPDQTEKVNETLIPVYLSAVLQFTNRSWFNAETPPIGYEPQNPALQGEKIPDGVVAEICSMIGSDLTGDADDPTREAKSISEGGISVTFASQSELENKFSVSRVISYYRAPSI
jgi:hypothetical protein